MNRTRLVILLVVLGGVTLFAVQNFSPALPLVFLGTKTISLPLSLWICLAGLAGFVTFWLIAILQGINTGTPSESNPSRRPESANTGPSYQKPEPPYVTPPSPFNLRKEQQSPAPVNPVWPRNSVIDAESVSISPPDDFTSADDWNQQETEEEREVWDDEDWGEAPVTVESMPTKLQDNSKTVIQDAEEWEDEGDWVEGDWESQREGRGDWETDMEESERDDQDQSEPVTYEVPQEPKVETWSGSIYAYSYREEDENDSNPEIQETPVTDKDQDTPNRVIIPPLSSHPGSDPGQKPPSPSTEDMDEEWL